ncbi:hypothetical protein [Anaeromyxobacter diazotrophicus]|uniref:Uncharacterized protein n=1 Tax=Anaeromyxobacter diazotrophicus TaxID=2590199 RepID=A0A7I9VLC4_9BACT|nr:hypothetical protein [Anaeromyxobacter diazotrophicus]GEJ57214.1 hypothetical protein AMYX_19550 [Anaeromyxobacter diazotrophicus]
MNTELQEETTTRDLDLPGACVGCGGPLAARFSPGRAHGVCFTCHLVSELGLARSAEGVQLIQLPRAAA